MKITEKGQVTIPIEMREAYGFLPHTEIEFVRKGKELVIRKSQKKSRGKKLSRGQALVAHLRKFSKHVNMTSDEVMALTRGY